MLSNSRNVVNEVDSNTRSYQLLKRENDLYKMKIEVLEFKNKKTRLRK
ncbi:MAG: hypothetical protein PUB18_02225 [bacterium]|nr:hypothetical protein [bacterium]